MYFFFTSGRMVRNYIVVTPFGGEARVCDRPKKFVVVPMINNCESYGGAEEKAYLDDYVLSHEYVTLVDLRGNQFHGCVVAYDNLTLLLGTHKKGVPPLLFNKQDIALLQRQGTKVSSERIKTKAKHIKA